MVDLLTRRNEAKEQRENKSMYRDCASVNVHTSVAAPASFAAVATLPNVARQVEGSGCDLAPGEDFGDELFPTSLMFVALNHF